MTLIADLKALFKPQRAAIWASYLGWTLDAFDFFLMVFMLSAIATEFGTDIKAVSVAIFMTLAARPFGALFRSEGRRVGNDCDRTCSSRWSAYRKNKNK